MKKIPFVIMLLFIIRIGFAGDVMNNSPEQQQEELFGIRKVDSLLSMTNMNISDSSGKAMTFCLQASELARLLNYKYGEALADYYFGKIYMKSDEFDEALKQYQNALEIFQRYNNDTMVVQIEIELGLVYFMKPAIELAIDHFNRALDSYTKSNDSAGISIVYYNLGRCYRKSGELDLALDNSIKSLQFNEKNNHNALNTISIIYAMKGDLVKAFEHQQRALDIRERLGLQEEVIGSLNNLGLISIRTNKPDQGLEYLLRSAKIAEEIGKKSQLNRALNNIGFVYDEFLGEPEMALKYYQRSLKISEEIQDNFETANTLINIGLLQSKLKKNNMALVNLEKGLTLAKEIKANELIKEAHISTSQLPPVNADASLIQHVIANLLSNAVKFTYLKEEADINVGSLNKDDQVIFYVKDNGIGFNMKYAGKLFNVFQKLHSAKEFEGSGVGLAIVYKIIQRHGGKVWAEAEVNKGATFYFSLTK